MSHILFGDFESQIINQDLINKVKEKLLHENILILFDHELDFSQEIEKMLDEHRSGNTHKFCITTTLQEYNSDDLLFPYDKYSNEELFPNGEDRVVFEKICSKNLLILEKVINEMRELLSTKFLRIFVTEGYDTEFSIVRCSIHELVNEIQMQVINSFFLRYNVEQLIWSRFEFTGNCIISNPTLPDLFKTVAVLESQDQLVGKKYKYGEFPPLNSKGW